MLFVSDHFMGLIHLCTQPAFGMILHDETNAQAYINTPTATLRHFLMSVYSLKCYPNEMQSTNMLVLISMQLVYRCMTINWYG